MPIIKASTTANSGAWEVLADVSLGTAAATLDSGTITAKTRLRITIKIPGFSASDIPRIQFNGDTGNNYSSARSVDGGATSNSTAQAGINLDNTARSNIWHGEFQVYNAGADGVSVIGQAFIPNVLIEAGGRWIPVGAPVDITSITLRGSSANNLQSGSRMIIEGSN